MDAQEDMTLGPGSPSDFAQFLRLTTEEPMVSQGSSPAAEALALEPNRQSESQLVPTEEAPSDSNKVYCSYPDCDRSFNNRHDLNHHQRYHVRPHKCPHPACDKAFSLKKDLRRHMKTHNRAERPRYYCTYASCDYAEGGNKCFTREDNKKRHIDTMHLKVQVEN